MTARNHSLPDIWLEVDNQEVVLITVLFKGRKEHPVITLCEGILIDDFDDMVGGYGHV